ncbi:MAG: MarR family transcriptional regulator [Cyclobacteriaceae bacterium]
MKEEDRPLEEVYFFWMDRAMKAQRKATNKLFKKLGISLTTDQWIILKRLDEKENQSQRELAAAVSKDPASITRSLDLLENDGLIERRSADRRSFTVHLTKKGSGLVARVIPEAVKYREMGIRNVTEDEMKVFRKVLNAIYKNFEEA